MLDKTANYQQRGGVPKALYSDRAGPTPAFSWSLSRQA
jgi:hypothetical protein